MTLSELASVKGQPSLQKSSSFLDKIKIQRDIVVEDDDDYDEDDDEDDGDDLL